MEWQYIFKPAFNICIPIFIKLDLYLFGLLLLHGSSLLSNASLPLLLQLI